MPDFQLDSLEIQGLWGFRDVSLSFQPDVNIIIGENGTGKTTILNIIYLTLTGDLTRLRRYSFESVRVKLAEPAGTRVRTIAVVRAAPGFVVKVGRRTYHIRLLDPEVRMGRIPLRRQAQYRSLREELAELTQTIWLPVSRRLPIPEDEEESFEIYARSRPRLESVEERLTAVVELLRDYRVRLEASLGAIYKDFERKVLTAILYDPELDTYEDLRIQGLTIEDKNKLLLAFAAADLLTPDMAEQIESHFRKAKSVVDRAGSGTRLNFDDVLILPLLTRTKKLSDYARDLELQREAVFARLQLYIETVNDFLIAKQISVEDSGRLVIHENNAGEDHESDAGDKPPRGVERDPRRRLMPSDLSSGEKQILIMLTSALIKSEEISIYLADEPELSLHVTWQAKLLEALAKLADQSQIVVATHSPDIVGDYINRVIRLSR
jgi:ABC-type lipoprotein export system ATPase subunit